MTEHTVKVVETILRTPSSISIRMEKPDGFDYLPGQWAIFSIDCPGETISKPLSFSSSPTEPFLEFTKRITGSSYCSGISSLAPGSSVTFEGPMGDLVYREGMDNLVFMAGGIGITPVRSILKYISDNGGNVTRHLIYSNRNIEEIAFGGELESFSSSDSLFKLTNILESPPPGWEGPAGFINGDIIKKQIPDLAGQTFFLCGPPVMVDCLLDDLKKLDVSEENINTEKLVGYEGLV